MPHRSRGPRRALAPALLALAHGGCAAPTAEPDAAVPREEHRRQTDALARPVEVERKRADEASREATALQREVERLVSQVDAARDTKGWC